MIKNKVYLGDEIITNKNAECGAGKKGKIICTHPNDETVYGILFASPSPKMHKLEPEKKGQTPMINTRQGLWLTKKDFSLEITEDKTKREYLNLMYKGFSDKLGEIPNQILDTERMIVAQKQFIIDKENSVATSRKKIIELQKEKKKLNKMKSPTPENFDLFYEKFRKNKYIKDVIIDSNYFIIKTNDLIYKHPDNKIIPDFNLGAYYIFFSVNGSNTVRAINYKKQIKKGSYFHPCIKLAGEMCLGTNVRNEKDKFIKNKEYISLAYLIINFLQAPNYGTPFNDASLFRCAQPVTFKPQNLMHYLDATFWRINEKWDEKKYLLECIDSFKKDSERLTKLIKEDNNYEQAKERAENNLGSFKSQYEALNREKSL